MYRCLAMSSCPFPFFSEWTLLNPAGSKVPRLAGTQGKRFALRSPPARGLFSLFQGVDVVWSRVSQSAGSWGRRFAIRSPPASGRFFFFRVRIPSGPGSLSWQVHGEKSDCHQKSSSKQTFSLFRGSDAICSKVPRSAGSRGKVVCHQKSSRK